MQPKRRMKKSKKSLKGMGAKKTGIRGEKQKKKRCNQNKNNKDWNIHVAIKEQQGKKHSGQQQKKKKKDRLTKEKVRSN